MSVKTILLLSSLLACPLTAQEAPKETPADAPAKAAPLEIGKRLSGDTTLKDIDGKEHGASQYRGKVVVVNFWSTTCPVMQGYEPTLEKVIGDYASKGVSFVMVNSNEANGEIGDAEPADEDAQPYQKIRDYLKAKKLRRTVLVDHGSVFADRCGAKTTPDIFVFDTTGRLVYRGLIDDDPRGDKGEEATHYLRDALDAVLAGQPVKIAETTPHGCSIKRPKPARRAQRG